jgi:hypothetical protein
VETVTNNIKTNKSSSRSEWYLENIVKKMKSWIATRCDFIVKEEVVIFIIWVIPKIPSRKIGLLNVCHTTTKKTQINIVKAINTLYKMFLL